MIPKTKCLSRVAIGIALMILFAIPTKSSAQESPYWMGLSTENPAVIGTPSDWVWGTVLFADIPDYDDGYSNFALFSDYEISPKAGSVGASFEWLSIGSWSAYLADFAYAYTLTGKKNREWNFGASIGFEGIKSDFGDDDVKADYLKSNLGVLYHSRKLDLGLSYGFYNELKNNYSGSYADSYVSFITAYRFIIKEKFVIEPYLRFLFQQNDNDGYLGLHLEYKDLVWVGYNWEGVDDLQTYSIGADISKRFRAAFNYSFIKNYGYKRSNFYQFSLGYRLN